MQQCTAHPPLAGKARRRLMFCLFCGRHIGSRLPSHPRAQATATIMPVVETFEGQLTRANVTLAVRSGVLTDAEAARYWQSRRKFRTLSDSNSGATIEKRTQEFEEAKARVLECMNTNTNSLLQRERGEKRKLEEEVRRLKRRLADAGLPHAGE